MATNYKYSIDLDERGCFAASVSNSRGRTVWQVHYPTFSCVNCGNSQDTCTCDNQEIVQDSTIFDDGYMRHKYDISGLESYLKQLAIMPQNAILKSAKNTRQY